MRRRQGRSTTPSPSGSPGKGFETGFFSEPRRSRRGVKKRERSSSEGDDLNHFGGDEIWNLYSKLDDGRWAQREEILRHALSPNTTPEARASVFVTIKSSSFVAGGMILALFTIGGTIASSLLFASDLQGLIYPYISETARDMPQTGFFGFGMTITSMVMVLCAVLQ